MSTKKKAKSEPKPKPNGAAKHRKGQRQAALPGMEDREIEKLRDAGLEYAEFRDARIEASAAEVQSKKALLDLMHSYKKTRYVHGRVFVEIVPEGEKLKVKILKEGEEAPPPKDDAEPPEAGEQEEESEAQPD